MPSAVVFEETGGPEVLRLIDEQAPDPGTGQVVVRHRAIGVNYIDVYQRSGTYAVPLPASIGMEAAGVIERIGPSVAGLKPGDRVAYLRSTDELGTYREIGLASAQRVVRLPDDVGDGEAAAVLAKGVTAMVLLQVVRPVQAGEPILIHAAAGGTGLLMCQLARAAGATVIGTVGSERKAEIAYVHGCEHPIVYTREDFAARVRDLTDGEGVAVVFDSVGAATFEGSLDSLRPYGMLVSFGSSSGPVGPVDPMVLRGHGSLAFTCPTTLTTLGQPGALVGVAAELFARIGAGDLTVVVDSALPLADAAEAHRRLEARTTIGATVLLPGPT